MSEEMQTEIEKRIERNCYGYENLEDVLVGAKFILELPELREAVEAMEFAAAEDMWESDGEYIESFSYQYKEWYQDKLDQALSKLKALGIVS